MIMRTIFIIVFAIAFAVIVLMFVRARRSASVVIPRFADCPQSPNCVSTKSSGDDRGQLMAPIPMTNHPDSAAAVIKNQMQTLERATLLEEDSIYLHYIVKSQFFQFIDDVEFLIDEPAGVVHFRSASRVGHSDFGVNRKRMEALRAAIAKSL